MTETRLHPDFDASRQERQASYEWIDTVQALLPRSLRRSVAVGSTGGSGLRRSSCALRSLYHTEVQALEARGCRSTDWSQCRLLLNNQSKRGWVGSGGSSDDDDDDDASEALRALVSDTHFDGFVVLVLVLDDNSNKNTNGSFRRQGLHKCSMVSNCIISLDGSCVVDNGLLQNVCVGPQAQIQRCGEIRGLHDNTSLQQTSWNLEIAVGPESGGSRPLHLTPEATMVDVGDQLRTPLSSPANTSSSDTSAAIQSFGWTVIEAEATVRDTPTVTHVFMHPHAIIEGAASVRDTLLLPHATIRQASIVEDCRLQWNASIVGHSHVTNTALFEQAAAGPSSTVAHTVLGPDAHVSCGEVHASVLGPNTNAHHQSLLISVLWPLGRGNVGYGANVGSNHTGRIPDQETVAGEGTFWGLSNVIKFPVNLHEAPYTIVAAGTTLNPQTVRMPFSLIVGSGNNNNDPSMVPGWVLSSSPYTLARSATKFRTRRKAIRHAASYETGWEILRPQTIRLVLQARQALLRLETSSPNSVYTEREIPGLGQTTLTERGRQSGIRAYTDCVQRYVLREGLLRRLTQRAATQSMDRHSLEECLEDVWNELQKSGSSSAGFIPKAMKTKDPVEWGSFPWEENQTDEEVWEFQKAILTTEFPMDAAAVDGKAQSMQVWMNQCLDTLIALEEDYSRRIFKCKARDDSRGQATIPGYASAHIAADQDDVVQQAQTDAQETVAQARAFQQGSSATPGISAPVSRSKL